MKLKSCYTALLTTVLFVLYLPLSAFTQENLGFEDELMVKGAVQQDQEMPSGGENPEIRNNKNSIAPSLPEPGAARETEIKTRETEVKISKPVTKMSEKSQKEDEKAQKREDDPLSFNFLYYIIEKFKLSDIVD